MASRPTTRAGASVHQNPIRPTARPRAHLSTETVERAPLALERVHDVQAGDGLALGVLGVGDGVADDGLEEGLEDTTGLFVDHCTTSAGGRSERGPSHTGRDTLDTTTTRQTTDRGLGDTLDVVSQNLPVTLGAALSKTLATFAACEDASVRGQEKGEARPEQRCTHVQS